MRIMTEEFIAPVLAFRGLSDEDNDDGETLLPDDNTYPDGEEGEGEGGGGLYEEEPPTPDRDEDSD